VPYLETKPRDCEAFVTSERKGDVDEVRIGADERYEIP
jgi:hypothetical protein